MGELGQLLSAGTVVQAISPQNASTVAVAGFWQLVRVSILNFAVLGVFYLIAKKPLWDQKGTRFAATILFIFTGLLALLAGWKLFGIYIYLLRTNIAALDFSMVYPSSLGLVPTDLDSFL